MAQSARTWEFSVLLPARRVLRFRCRSARQLAWFVQTLHLLAASYAVEEVAA
jgi:hypothetical protein